MRQSGEEIERAVSCLRQFLPKHRGISGWIFGLWPDDSTYGYTQCPPSEFLVRLGQTVYRAASYQRWVSFAHSLMQVMSLFRLEGD